MSSYNFTFTVDDIVTASIGEALGSTQSIVPSLSEKSLIRQLSFITNTFLQKASTERTNETWSFQNNNTELQHYIDNTVGVASVAGALTFTLGSTNTYPTSGRLAIFTKEEVMDIVDYTNIVGLIVTVSTASGASLLTTAHEVGNRIQYLMPLPSDTDKVTRLYSDDGTYVEAKKGFSVVPRTYRIINSTSLNYILVPQGIRSKPYGLEYSKKGSTLYSGDTGVDRIKVMPIPDEFSRYPIEKLNEYIFSRRFKKEDASIARVMAQEELEQALSYDTNNGSNDYIYASF